MADLGFQLWEIDFSSKMLDEAQEKLPSAVLNRADLLDGWPSELRRRFDRVVSSYALHHFDLDTTQRLLSRVCQGMLASDGKVVVADVSYPSGLAREEARLALGETWKEDEYYWAADETKVGFAGVGLHCEYVQVSSCGGV